MIDDQSNTPFAEIDIGSSQSRSSFEKHALRLSSSAAAQSQPITPREIDPLRMKFYEMRKLASVRPFAATDSDLFYKQAKFMEDFSDDYAGNAKLNMYYPYYQNMGYDYLRTYFSWRTKVRGGEFLSTSLSYIFLYIYELLSGIGVDNPYQGLCKLLAVWYAYAKGAPAVEKYLTKWFKDYHVFYEMPHSFSDFVTEHNLQEHYQLTFLFDENVKDKFELWRGVSGYDVASSKFYNDGNQQLFSDCFNAVLEHIEDFCKRRNTRFEDLLIYSVSKRTPWAPFEQALFKSNYVQPDREVQFSNYERYYCKNGMWTAKKPIFYSSQKDFVGYIIKKTEACLRNVTNYKYKLVADIKPGVKPFRELRRLAVKRAELANEIEKAVAEFHHGLTRTVVKVDHENLVRIRSEALETQDQLVVSESELQASVMETTPVPPTFPSGVTLSPIKKLTPSEQDEPIALTMSYSGGWSVLKSSFTDVEQRALSVVAAGGDLKAFADENGTMLEILVDGINEKAADCIGDSILELCEDVYIYDEYREHLDIDNFSA